MFVDKLRTLQNRLVETQVDIANLIEEDDVQKLNLINIDCSPKLEIINNTLKITIPEYPPKVSIYQKYEVVDGFVRSFAYQEARNRWYSLIHKALKGYQGKRIDPAIVYIVYYVPRICDVSNFISKMIIDGLMYAGAIAKDDNLKHVPIEIQEARLDKDNPRTEIYVIKYKNQVEKALFPWKFNKGDNSEKK